MRKLFISQPFSGRPEEEIFAERERVIEFVTSFMGEEFDVIDQFHQEKPKCKRGENRFFYLSNDLIWLGEADLIVFTHDSASAKGCRVEYTVASEYGLNFFILPPL